MYEDERNIALSTFEKIRAEFPRLTMTLDLLPKNVEIAMHIPVQTGLSFDVYLNLQNRDELHVVVSKFWMDWFPCTNQKKVDRYLEAVSGLLSGEFRIVEHWRGRRIVLAQLQRPNGDAWEAIARSLNPTILFPWPPKTLKVIQNTRAVD
ncbi:MAG TPA: hypothetical protein VKB26_01565 [Candidatus Acidoferrales bacterium]|nr:hypothetical protein [Candidatus Acidoferrales bacterium]